MRYVVVTVADGEAGVFNKKLSAEAFEKFKVKSSKLPAHITLKAPFETEEPIEVLEEAIEKYIKDKPHGSTTHGGNGIPTPEPVPHDEHL